MATDTLRSRPNRPPDANPFAHTVLPFSLLGVLTAGVGAAVFLLVRRYAWGAVEGTGNEQREFVWRRLLEPLHMFGREVDGRWWILILLLVLLAAAVYVVAMYVRDSRTVGGAWAAFLGGLRCTTYGILALVFLLPAWQTFEKTETRSKVVVLLDVSGSMGAKDDLPTEAIPVEKLLSRQDKVIQFLSNEQINCLKRLQEKNPVSVYRFGDLGRDKVDDEFRTLDGGQQLTAAELNTWLKPDGDLQIPQNLDKEETLKLTRKRELYAGLVKGTNLAESILSVLNREASNRLQGIIVVSDGRSTQYSAETLEKVKSRAAKVQVPIFTVAVGEERPPINIRITDLQVPDQARPDDKFPVRVEVDGEGKPGEDVKVTLDFYKPQSDPKKDKPVHQMEAQGKFSQQGTPPHAQVEFQVDAAQLPPELRNPDSPAKPELAEGEWKVVARVAKDNREAFLDKEHVSDPATVNVVKKPVRVLLFASAPTRDYQFARTLFVREVDRRRAELSIYLQLGRPEIVQDVPPERLLKRFPGNLLDVDEKIEDKYDNLAQYDLIIAFDPDWTQLTPEQIGLLEKWVGQHAGGLVVVAGPINTYQLVKAANYDKVRPILDLYPVILDDSRIRGLGVDRTASEPWRLNFPGASTETEFLKLNDAGDDVLAGWEEFFTGQQKNEGGKDVPLRRGFYSYYPVKDKKPSATVVATYADPRARLNDGREQPFLVTAPYGNGKVVYIGSGELWRLRQCHEAFHERFWTKLARYAGSGNLTRLNRHGIIVMSKSFRANRYVRLEAQLFGRDMQPLPQKPNPVLELKPPSGVQMPTKVELQPKPSSGAEWNGWFTTRFLVTSPGSYELKLPIPGTDDVLNDKFVVKESNPELDNTMPDFAQLYQLASDASVLSRIKEEQRDKVREQLERTNSAQAPGSVGENKDKLRLFFDLKGAELIPDCMVRDVRPQEIRGPVKDLWDSGFNVPWFSWANGLRTYWPDPPLRVSYILLTVVGLLSLEWLTRKLLKLA